MIFREGRGREEASTRICCLHQAAATLVMAFDLELDPGPPGVQAYVLTTVQHWSGLQVVI